MIWRAKVLRRSIPHALQEAHMADKKTGGGKGGPDLAGGKKQAGGAAGSKPVQVNPGFKGGGKGGGGKK
jgi:hypothetical protein